MAASAQAVKVRPVSRPAGWFSLAPKDSWRHAAADSAEPKGLASIGTRLRRLLWSWWPWAMLTVWAAVNDEWWWAIVTTALTLIAYLTAPAALPPRYGLDHDFAIDAPEFLPTLAGATGSPMTHGNVVTLLNNGDAFYPAMLRAIEEATHSITIEAYIYWAGDIGNVFATALARRARSGVTVKILLDAVGSASIGEEILKTLKDGGCQIAWYNRIHWYTLGRFNNRTHRKSLILDGRVAFTGGAGIADHWKGDARGPDEWRDLQIRIEGAAVVPLQTGFAHNWQQTTGELVTGEHYYPAPGTPGSLALQTLLSSPEMGHSVVRTMYYLSIVCARHSIFIANPYFLPDAVAIDILLDAKRRGVEVRIMVSGIRNDNWLARHNSVRLFGRLLEAGIEVLEYNRSMLHHKTMVVDRLWSTVGTTNFDNRSFAHNEESNISCADSDLARQLHDIFLEDVDGCTPVTFDSWKRRGLKARAQEWLASLLQEQA